MKGSLISTPNKNGNQIFVGQFGTTNNPVALSAESFYNILPMQLFLSSRDTERAFVTSANESGLYKKNLSKWVFSLDANKSISG